MTEKERLHELYSYEILDTPAEQSFNDIVQLASDITGMPISTLSFIDRDRQWIKARIGLEATETSLEDSFCVHAIREENDSMIVKDASKDRRFKDNRFVNGDPGIRFYAGFPMVTDNGARLGSLCVIDSKPNKLSEQQKSFLKTLSRQAMNLLKLHISNKKLHEMHLKSANQNSKLKTLVGSQKKMMAILAHDTRAPLFSIKQTLEMCLKNKFRKEDYPEIFELLTKDSAHALAIVEELIRWGKTYLTATGNTPSQFNLLDILDEAIQSLDHLVRNKALVISRDIEDCALKINPEVLKFVLRNLLSNAVKFTSEGSIMVRGGKSGSEYELSVQDEGIGMPASVLKSLQTGKTFSRSGTKGEKGTGVGFILMANILKELHCDIRIKSKQGKGTMVTVLIPIKENNHSFASAVNQLS